MSGKMEKPAGHFGAPHTANARVAGTPTMLAPGKSTLVCQAPGVEAALHAGERGEVGLSRERSAERRAALRPTSLQRPTIEQLFGGPRTAIQARPAAAALREDIDRAALRDLPGSGGHPLPDLVQRKMEGAHGADFSTVRIHEDDRPAQIGARAFTAGEHIHVQAGHYDPTSSAGQELLGHELTHVLQQRAGRVNISPDATTPINTDASLEVEADAHGARAARGEPIGAAPAGARASAGAVQCSLAKWEDIAKSEDEQTDWEPFKTTPEASTDPKFYELTAHGRGATISKTKAQWETEIKWGATHDNGDGQSMVADPLGPDHKMGEGPTNGKNIWTENREQLERASGEPYVAGHLLNHHLGGPGNDSRNLAVIPQTANAEHEKTVESAIKRLVNDHHVWIYYSVTTEQENCVKTLGRDEAGPSKKGDDPPSASLSVYDFDAPPDELPYISRLICHWHQLRTVAPSRSAASSARRPSASRTRREKIADTVGEKIIHIAPPAGWSRQASAKKNGQRQNSKQAAKQWHNSSNLDKPHHEAARTRLAYDELVLDDPQSLRHQRAVMLPLIEQFRKQTLDEHTIDAIAKVVDHLRPRTIEIDAYDHVIEASEQIDKLSEEQLRQLIREINVEWVAAAKSAKHRRANAVKALATLKDQPEINELLRKAFDGDTYNEDLAGAAAKAISRAGDALSILEHVRQANDTEGTPLSRTAAWKKATGKDFPNQYEAQRVGTRMLADDSQLIFEDLEPQGSEERARLIVSGFQSSGFFRWPPPRADNLQEDILHVIAVSDRSDQRKCELLRQQLKDYAAGYTSWYSGYLDHLEEVLDGEGDPTSKVPAGSSQAVNLTSQPPRKPVPTAMRSSPRSDTFSFSSAKLVPAYVRKKKPSPGTAAKPPVGQGDEKQKDSYATLTRAKGSASAKRRPIVAKGKNAGNDDSGGE